MSKKKKVVKKAAPKAVAKKIAAPSKAAVVLPKTRSATKPRNTSSLSYTLSEVIENIRGFSGLTKRAQAKEIAEDIAAFLTDALKRGYKVPLLGLGKIYIRNTKPRVGRNPATGAEIQIPAKKRIRFSASKSLKEAVL